MRFLFFELHTNDELSLNIVINGFLMNDYRVLSLCLTLILNLCR